MYDAGRIADNSYAVGDITNHHRPSTNGAPPANFNTGNYDCTSPYVSPLAYFDVTTQSGMRRNMGIIAYYVVVVDAGGCVDEHMATNHGVGLHDGAM